ncbi:MAG TPA: EamA family transporter [Lentisphaeria bacterium]|nr:EamA family transporter [Lentisphaeria bacterium]
MKKNKSVLVGWLALLVSIILFSTVEIVGKKINAKATIEPFTMVFLRFFLTGIVLTCLSLPGYFRRGHRLGWGDLKHFLVNGAVGIAVSISLFHAAIEMFTNASSSAVVFSANGVFTAVLARFMNNEPWSWRKWCAVIFGILGVSLFIRESGAPTRGAIYALLVMSLAALCFSFSVCYARRYGAKYGPMLFMGASSLIGGLLTLPLAWWRRAEDTCAELGAVIPEMFYMVFICTTLAYYLFYIGIAKTTAFGASMSFFLKPVLACIFAWILLGEQMNAWTISGTAMIMVGMSFIINFKALREAWRS